MWWENTVDLDHRNADPKMYLFYGGEWVRMCPNRKKHSEEIVEILFGSEALLLRRPSPVSLGSYAATCYLL